MQVVKENANDSDGEVCPVTGSKDVPNFAPFDGVLCHLMKECGGNVQMTFAEPDQQGNRCLYRA